MKFVAVLILLTSLTRCFAASLIERGPWSGAVTPHSATVKAKLAKQANVARLIVRKTAEPTVGVFSEPVKPTPDHNNIVTLSVNGLEPNTQYYYVLEINGRIDQTQIGALRTFPLAPASFTFAFGSCARTASINPVFNTIRANRPLFFMTTGDFHYLNITNGDIRDFRAAYDRVLASPQQALLYRTTPFVYLWDDHDYGGNNSNRRAYSHAAACRIYREYVPHYPLIARGTNAAITQTFTVGRAKFILTDLRSERDPAGQVDDASKSMLGNLQKEWFKQELLASNGKFPLIFWVSSVPWIGQNGRNFYPLSTHYSGYFHHTKLLGAGIAPARDGGSNSEDYWGVFSHERREIANFIKENKIRGLCILHGDSHMLAADNGQNSDYATGGGAPIPVMAAAPLDQDASVKGGPYSQGIYKPIRGEGCFGMVTVSDNGEQINVTFSGRNYRNEEKVGLKFSVSGN